MAAAQKSPGARQYTKRPFTCQQSLIQVNGQPTISPIKQCDATVGPDTACLRANIQAIMWIDCKRELGLSPQALGRVVSARRRVTEASKVAKFLGLNPLPLAESMS